MVSGFFVSCPHFCVGFRVLPSFAIISLGKRESWLLYFNCILDCLLDVICHASLLIKPWVGLQCVNVPFPGS